jgi:hypothetical protein
VDRTDGLSCDFGDSSQGAPHDFRRQRDALSRDAGAAARAELDGARTKTKRALRERDCDWIFDERATLEAGLGVGCQRHYKPVANLKLVTPPNLVMIAVGAPK